MPITKTIQYLIVEITVNRCSNKKGHGMYQLKCENLSVGYEKDCIVKDCSFEIEKGDYICILGENGVGKSTLMKGILGLAPLQGGSILYGEGITKKNIGYLPQQNGIQTDFPASVYEVVLSGCINKIGFSPFYKKEHKLLAKENMKKLDILNLKNQPFGTLSGGQQQRVLLARALCATDKLIFLDEPVSGLDPKVTAEFYELLSKCNRTMNISIVMISHDIQNALQYANKILVIREKDYLFTTVQEYKDSVKGTGYAEWRK